MEVAVLALIPILAFAALFLWIAWKVLKGILWLLGRLFRGIGALFSGLFGFAKREIAECARIAGALVSGAVLLPASLVSALFGRFESARHYGRAIEDEITNVLLGIWRVGFAHPLRLVGLGGALEGVEGRIPDVFARAPKSAARARAVALEFPGYEITSPLPSGGSGALLYLARPHPETLRRFQGVGRELPSEVVIKSFALVQGSTLPQIVRESRALEAAGRLGLVYEHHLDDERFWYVMRYVRGETLDTALQRLHGRAGADGLATRELALVLGYAKDLLGALERFHAGGLWHKDVKPANLIVAADRAHLVDFGLVTPLASAMTLTTHGTEYYRDPEMVRLAMQGVKVHEVDGVKFDLYSAGAVLYTMVEDSFPAHGSLSRITKRCPEALSWIIRRAMADIGTRYSSAREVLADLEALASAKDPFGLTPAELPSVRGIAAEGVDLRAAPPPAGAPARDVPSSGGAGADPARSPRFTRSRWCVDTVRPVTAGARRFRRAILAAVVVFVGFHLAARFFREDAQASPPVELARNLVPRLEAAERRAYEAARAVLSRSDLDDRAQGLAQGWNERLASLAPVREGARALVLESPASPIDPESLRALVRALEAKGFEVAGSNDGSDPAEIDLLGRARLAARLAEPTDDDALARMQEYVDSESGIDVLLWVADVDGSGTILRVLSRAPDPAAPALETAWVTRRSR